MRTVQWILAAILMLDCTTTDAADSFTELFAEDGVPKGWIVTSWNDLSKPPEQEVKWTVKDGVLTSGAPRGTWLVSEKEYGDFVFEFEFKLGELGNSGCALRTPLAGDPAFEAMELQMADLRYNTMAADSELTGGIYRAIAPRKQVYKPTEWNKYQITLQGTRLKVVLNGELIHDLDLAEQDQEVKRHDGSVAPKVKDRPSNCPYCASIHQQGRALPTPRIMHNLHKMHNE
jgi:hypothetical protein